MGDVTALVNYYCREGHWRHIQTVCEDVLRSRGHEPTLAFWKAYGVGREGNINQTIRELGVLRGKRDLELPATEALLYWHNSVKLRDHEALTELNKALGQVEERASESSLLLAATFQLHVGDFGRARKLCQRVQEQSPMNTKALTLRGWIELTCKAKTKKEMEARARSVQFFEEANAQLSGNKKDLEATMGMAAYFLDQRRYRDALEHLNQVIVMYAWFLPALSEKAKLLMLIGDWDQSLETAERVLQQDANHIEALRVQAMFELTRNSDSAAASMKIAQVTEAIDRHEPNNAELYFGASQPLARVAGHAEDVLRKTLTLVDRAKKLQPENSAFVTESGYQLSLLGRYERAMAEYEAATQLDESNVAALYGQIYCLIQQGELSDAEQQLEFLLVVSESIGKTAQMSFLGALLAWRLEENARKAAKLLDETCSLHIKSLRNPAPSSTYEYFVRFNPDFLLEVAGEYMQHVGTEPMDVAEEKPKALVRGTKLLEKVANQVPGMLQVQLSLAKARFIANDTERASSTLQACLAKDPKFSDAHLTMAQIALHKEDYRGAENSLQQAVSHNFDVRDSPLFHLVKARVVEAKGDLDEALAILEQAMALPGVRTSKVGKAKFGKAAKPIPLHDRASIFIQLGMLLVQLKRVADAVKLIKDAQREFSGTSEEVRVVLAHSDLALKRGDVRSALRALDAVPEDSPAYMRAHMAKASIYLNHRNDKQAYSRCYMELVEKNPSAHTFVLLGEAYMRINLPDDAIEAYEQALRMNPSDSALASRIGKALVSTHDYMRAVEYYQSALRSSPSPSLRHDLAELYFKLKKYDKASDEIEATLQDLESGGSKEGKSAGSRTRALMMQVRETKLLARVHKGAGSLKESVEALKSARELQTEVLNNIRGSSNPQEAGAQKQEMAEICFLLASHHETAERDDDRAIAFYKDAQKHDDGHVPSMLALAKLHLRRGELDKCQHQCIALMRVDDRNEEASMMLADLMFQKSEFQTATYHYQELLGKKPAHFSALSKLIVLLYRAGKLQMADKFLKAAEHSSPRAAHDPGFYYCKGLYNRLGNDVNDAIAYLNKARRDVVWGPQALKLMIEVYLNPDNANMWEDHTGVDTVDSQEAVRTAQQLLAEMTDRQSDEYQVLECYAMMASKGRPQIERATQTLVEIVNNDRDNVPALLALATALMMLKQTPKARNQLKRISKMPYNQEQAESFEKCWLLLADIFIGSGKYDLAQDLCKRCLKYNKSCAKAWEYMGLVMEKEASYRDAAENYEQAWNFQKQSNASVGYKLAFNYLKANRIKKDILDKARAALRP